MIPTRDEIERWIVTMRDEIDRLTDANANLTRQVEWEQRAWPMWMEKALGKPLEGRTPSMVQVQLTKLFDAIQADLDRANTEAALARDALAKATTPAPEREAAIRAWEEEARSVYDGYYVACFILEPCEVDAAVAMMRSADGKELLRELRAWICDEWATHVGGGDIRRILDGIDELLALPAPVERPAAAVPDHVPDAGKMVPVLYWLEDGKFARAMLVGKDLLVVDLTFGDGPSVVGKPEWFDAGYVAAYGGLVPESATRGKEPGQWDYGVASIVKPSAAVPDPANEHMQCGQCGYFMTKGSICTKCGWIDKPAAAVPDDPRWELVAQLADAVVTLCDGQGFGVTLSEVQAIAAKLRGGA